MKTFSTVRSCMSGVAATVVRNRRPSRTKRATDVNLRWAQCPTLTASLDLKLLVGIQSSGFPTIHDA